MVDNHAAFFNCTPVTLRWLRHKVIRFSWLGPELLVCCLVHRGSTSVFILLNKLFGTVGQLTEFVESSCLIHQGGYHALFVCR